MAYRTICLFLLAGLLLGLAACAAELPPVSEIATKSNPDVIAATASRLAPGDGPVASRFTAAPVATARPGSTPGPTITVPGTPLPSEEAPLYTPLDPSLPTPPTAVPTPVPLLQSGEDVTVFALLGNDVAARKGGRTDSIVLAAVNTAAKTITLLSIPRDLYVAIPGWTMQRINLAYAHGGGGDQEGSDLFKETVAYNLGLPVDHTIRAGFDGFRQIVDALGGMEVVVNCPVEDWRLKSADLDPQVEENWEPFKLNYGIQQMDGELALWYARSRRGSNDFDRGRRQQKIMNALGRKAGSSEVGLQELPALVQALWPYVDSDLSAGEALALAALAPELNEYTVHGLLLPQEALRPWRVPGSGEAVQLLDRETAVSTLQTFLNDPALRAASSAPIRVAIQSDDYVLYRQAAENLAWLGFEAVYEPAGQEVTETAITYYGPSLKGAYAERLAWIFRQETTAIRLQDSSGAESVDYRVLLAPDYNPCLDYLAGPASGE